MFYTLYKTGVLDYSIDERTEAPGLPKFNTNSFEFLIPSLYFKYPGYNMTATFVPQKSPLFIIDGGNSDSFNISAQYSGTFNVITKDGVVEAFTLGISINAYGLIYLLSNTVRCKLNTALVGLTLISSNIGTFSPSALEVVINSEMVSTVIPEINNGTLATGIAIPVIDGIQLVNPSIESAVGYFTLSADFKYAGKRLLKHN